MNTEPEIMMRRTPPTPDYSNGTQPMSLLDLQPGRPFNNVDCALLACSIRQGKNGPYADFKFRDCTGERSGRWFNGFEENFPQLQSGQIVRISGRVNHGGSFHGDLVLHNCFPIQSPDDLTPFLPPLPTDHAAHRARFKEVLRSVDHPQLKALLKEIFRTDGEIWKEFETAPAAQNMHHAYRGGLMEHSGEVAILCDRVASTLPHLDRDLLVTAALLHDIGKLEEMENDLNAGQYTAAGHLVGHVVLGTCTVAAAASRLDSFPAGLKHELMHLILSHHGRLEHGAARQPMCAEAMILSLCDLMSAKVAQCREKLGEENCGEFTSLYGWETKHIYMGAMQRTLSEAESTLASSQDERES